MPGNNGGPPDKWTKHQLPMVFTSDDILTILNTGNGSTIPVTAAFTQRCEDGMFLFLGYYVQSDPQ